VRGALAPVDHGMSGTRGGKVIGSRAGAVVYRLLLAVSTVSGFVPV